MTILQPEEIAVRLKKSKRWVYDHGAALGGRKIGGSWFFTEEGLEHAILGQIEKTVARAGQMEWSATSVRLRHQERSRGLGIGKAKGAAQGVRENDADRHGLGDFV